MRVLLGAALVAAASAKHHRVCNDPVNAGCTACADDFAKCGGMDLENADVASIKDADAANCTNQLQAIIRAGEAAAGEDETLCTAYKGVYTKAVAAATAVWTATVPEVVKSCKIGDDAAGDDQDKTTCEVAAVYAAATGTCADAGDVAIDANDTWTAATCAANDATNNFTEVVAESCTSGALAVTFTAGDAASCTDQVPTFTAAAAEVPGSCNNAAGDDTAGNAVLAGAGTDANCDQLKDAGAKAFCTIGGDARVADNDGTAATFTGTCTAELAGACSNTCKDAPKADGSAASADDGSAASPAAMIATGMAFLALFL